MLGHLMEWFYAGLAGIKQADNSVAYNKIEIKPHRLVMSLLLRQLIILLMEKL
jgi:hypothetical protein